MRATLKPMQFVAIMLLAVAAGAAAQAAQTGQTAQTAQAGDVASGKKVAFSRKQGNCIACHSLPGAAMPGNVGPPLGAWIRSTFRTEHALVRYLYDPAAKIRHVVMPEFGKNRILTRRQLQQVADYLWSLKH